ncbi:MAG: hypothetical protein AVDCRST_MAG33-2356 [uncultured Thermomicrobiales bacterium]|uniref:Uncharacterized protein n=1 Tax=uncultured Thermomicrobiales bacterium TaxID=1645740 RepID=A0A6J4V7A3_9BACT|nr:MAG: hypothetical protein AVDCRST_MAG33-2356 [uncultured Thermomicrobiales bacterium]
MAPGAWTQRVAMPDRHLMLCLKDTAPRPASGPESAIRAGFTMS